MLVRYRWNKNASTEPLQLLQEGYRDEHIAWNNAFKNWTAPNLTNWTGVILLQENTHYRVAKNITESVKDRMKNSSAKYLTISQLE